MALSLNHLEKWAEAMPPPSQPELQILKAHILAEQSLIRYLSHRLPNPEAIWDGARFSDRVAIAQAITPDSKMDWIWDALRALNKRRNSLAHKINDPKTTELNNALIKCAEGSPHWLAESGDGKSVGATPMMQALFLVSNELHARTSVDEAVGDSLKIPREVEGSRGDI